MPRIGARPERKRELLEAALITIGESGSLDVSVKQIANRAGMSSALAFHYFGGKEMIVSETMRFLLRELAKGMRLGLEGKSDPRTRLDAIVEASFLPGQFNRKTIAAWLVFYVHAYSSKSAARLLNIYTRRLQSNLVHSYKLILKNEAMAYNAAEATAAIIDGVFIRHALRKAGPDCNEAIAICKTQIRNQLKRSR